MNTEVVNLISDKRNISESDKRKRNKLKRELGTLYELLQEEAVQEILVNPDGIIWVDKAGEERQQYGAMSETERLTFLSTVASSLNTYIDEKRPYIDGPLILDGSRVSGEIPPIVDAPAIRIRKHAKYVKPLDWFVETGTMSARQYEQIQDAIRAKKNIVIVGSTASGKTFLAKSVLSEISRLAPTDRILTVEDTPELVVTSKDSIRWMTSSTVDMQLMLKRALRATPDRIVVGEVRGGEAYQLLKMWNTGHDGGVATIHSNKGEIDGLSRLERMCGESEETTGNGVIWIRELIADVVDVLVNIVNEKGVRRIDSIVIVNGLSERGKGYEYEVFR